MAILHNIFIVIFAQSNANGGPYLLQTDAASGILLVNGIDKLLIVGPPVGGNGPSLDFSQATNSEYLGTVIH